VLGFTLMNHTCHLAMRYLQLVILLYHVEAITLIRPGHVTYMRMKRHKIVEGLVNQHAAPFLEDLKPVMLFKCREKLAFIL
jgi:hypothetical protein